MYHRQRAQDEAATHTAMLEEVNTKCKQLTATNQEVVAKCDGLKASLVVKEQTCNSQQLQLEATVKAERSQSVTHRTKVKELTTC
jgi:hypothetical protein